MRQPDLPLSARQPVTDVRALVASDIRLYREGLMERLGRVPSLQVVGSATDLASTVDAARELAPDIVLLDLAMPSGLTAVRELRDAASAKVVVLGVREAESDVVECAEAGVAGYVTRDASLRELVEVVESVARGEMVCSPRIAALLLHRVAEAAGSRDSGDHARRLSQRELEVAALIDEGLSNKEIAGRLSIELATVKNHVHNILDKLEVHSRTDAAAQLRGPAI